MDEADLIAAGTAPAAGNATGRPPDARRELGARLDGEAAGGKQRVHRAPASQVPVDSAPANPAPPDSAPALPDPGPAVDRDAPGFHPTGDLIRRLRRTSGFSVAEFAALLQVTAATVRRWEAAPGSLTLRSGPRDALQTLLGAIEGERHVTLLCLEAQVILWRTSFGT